MEHKLIITSLDDAIAECSCGTWSIALTGPMLKAEIQREHIRHVRALDKQADKIEKELRDRWTREGVPKEKQDAIIREVEEKAKPGAMVGPFKIPE